MVRMSRDIVQVGGSYCILQPPNKTADNQYADSWDFSEFFFFFSFSTCILHMQVCALTVCICYMLYAYWTYIIHTVIFSIWYTKYSYTSFLQTHCTSLWIYKWYSIGYRQFITWLPVSWHSSCSLLYKDDVLQLISLSLSLHCFAGKRMI